MIREKQDNFIETLNDLPDWNEKFNYLIELGEDLPETCPEKLLPYRFEFCQSKTCFYAENYKGKIKIYGWSNSAVMAGIISLFQQIFYNQDATELKNTEIDFHIKTALIENITLLRRQSLERMIDEIKKLSFFN
jgi:cysteine desulfuration protein SufE